MLYLHSNVGANVLIADNIQNIDFAELATPIVVSIFPSMKSGIPGLQGISTVLVNSMANGAANAFLTLRVGLLAKAYCEALTTPSQGAVRQSTTTKALGLVATIVKEQGRRVASKSWDTVRDSVSWIICPCIGSRRSATAMAYRLPVRRWRSGSASWA